MIEFINRETGGVEAYRTLIHRAKQAAVAVGGSGFIDVAALLHVGMSLEEIAVAEPDLAGLANWLNEEMEVRRG